MAGPETDGPARDEPADGTRPRRVEDTTSPEYARRLEELEGARWKRLLDVQAPYRWNLRRLLGTRRTLDVGCGIGRNLRHLAPGSVGVDHNPSSVDFCRARGLEAYLPDELESRTPPDQQGFDGVLVAHVLEHLEPGSQESFLRHYLRFAARGARVVVICPQERGYASDASHTDFVDGDRIVATCRALGLRVTGSRSFPLPRAAGRLFTYNEFVVTATVPG